MKSPKHDPAEYTQAAKDLLRANPVLQAPGFATRVTQWNKLKTEAAAAGMSEEEAAQYIANEMETP